MVITLQNQSVTGKQMDRQDNYYNPLAHARWGLMISSQPMTLVRLPLSISHVSQSLCPSTMITYALWNYYLSFLVPPAFSYNSRHFLNCLLLNTLPCTWKRGDTKVHINSVTFVSKKFSEVCGVFFRVLFSSSRLFPLYLCFLCAGNVQQMEKANWWGIILKRQE